MHIAIYSFCHKLSTMNAYCTKSSCTDTNASRLMQHNIANLYEDNYLFHHDMDTFQNKIV